MSGELAGSFAARRASQSFLPRSGASGQKLLLLAQQLCSEVSAGAQAFGDGR